MKVGYINLHVGDVRRELEFYRDLLDLPVVFQDEPLRFVRFDAGVGLAIVDGGVKAPDPQEDRLTGIGFVVPDVDAAYAALEQKGVRFTMKPARQPWGGYMAMFADPEGNVFYLDTAR